jgi:HAD superfamily hydrolase (TIGR01509 family)
MELTDITAVLLDMDGTLVDSDAAVDRAWKVWCGEYGIDPARARAVAHGNPADRTVRILRPDLDEVGITAAAARQLTLQYDDLSDVGPTTGALELVRALDALALPWAVVTSADVRLAKARLAAAGITARLLITREHVRVGKPDPEGFRVAAERLGVDITRCLVVEDSEPGIAAGTAAGAAVATLRGLPGGLQLDDVGQLARMIVSARRPSRTGEIPAITV